MITSLVGSLCV